MSDLPSKKEVRNRFIKGVGGIAGGAGLAFLGFLAGSGFSLVGVIAGGLITGLGALISTSEKERKTGLAVGGIGALTLAASLGLPFISGIGSWIMGLGTLGALAFGGFNLFQYFKGMKERK